MDSSITEDVSLNISKDTLCVSDNAMPGEEVSPSSIVPEINEPPAPGTSGTMNVLETSESTVPGISGTMNVQETSKPTVLDACGKIIPEISESQSSSNKQTPPSSAESESSSHEATVDKVILKSSVDVGTVTSAAGLGALGGLLVYESSDSEADEAEAARTNYRELQSDSDSSETDSETDSSSDSESWSSSGRISPLSDSDRVPASRKKNNTKFKPPRTEGELLLDDLPAIEDLHIVVAEQECMEIGKISSIVDALVVVISNKKTPTLDLDSVLFLDKGQRTLGRIFDVIGPVSEPAYCVRFNSPEEISTKGIEKGATVYCAPKTDHTSYVFISELLKMKGSDASWKANNEPPVEHLEFSDDEEERRLRRRKRPLGEEDGEIANASAESANGQAVVVPNSYERHMNAKNLARSQAPLSVLAMASRQASNTSVPRFGGRGRGWPRPTSSVPSVQNRPAAKIGSHPYPPPMAPGFSGYPVVRPTWPPAPVMFPPVLAPLASPYQFGTGMGQFFSMPPPPINPHLFAGPPPLPQPRNPFRHPPPPF